MGVLVMKNRCHSQDSRCDDSQAENKDRNAAIAPRDFHRSERQPYLKESQNGLVERDRLHHFEIPFSATVVDDLAEKLTANFGFQNQRLVFLLSDTVGIGMGDNI